MSIFKKLDAMSSRIIDVVNATRIRFIPMADSTNPNARRAQDPAREVVEVEGVFEYNSIEFGMELGVRKSYREANDLRNVSVGRTPHISVDRRWFPDHLKEPRQGDKMIILLDDGSIDPSYPVFELMDNQRDGLARFESRLVQLDSQT